jgi:hypothetical protein
MNSRFLRRPRLLAVLSAFGSFVLAGMVFYLSRPSPAERLQTYLGQDLRTLSEDEQIIFDGLIARLAPDAQVFSSPVRPQTWNPRDRRDYYNARPRAFFCRSWYIWRVANGQGPDRLVLLQGEPLWEIPSSSSARIFVFDLDGRALTRCDVQTGWRINIEDARWLGDSGHGFPCLLICSSPSINGADITSQYYAFLDDTFALVRLENCAGEFVTVNYHNPNHTIGPPVPERTPEQWEAALRSLNNAEVLRTLVWLGGRHSDPPLREKGICIEEFEDATRALTTRGRPGVRSAVEALTHSDDRWLRDAAKNAWEAIRGGDR